MQGEGRKLTQLCVEKAGTELQKTRLVCDRLVLVIFLFNLTMAVTVCQHLSQALGFV